MDGAGGVAGATISSGGSTLSSARDLVRESCIVVNGSHRAFHRKIEGANRKIFNGPSIS